MTCGWFRCARCVREVIVTRNRSVRRVEHVPDSKHSLIPRYLTTRKQRSDHKSDGLEEVSNIVQPRNPKSQVKPSDIDVNKMSVKSSDSALDPGIFSPPPDSESSIIDKSSKLQLSEKESHDSIPNINVEKMSPRKLAYATDHITICPPLPPGEAMTCIEGFFTQSLSLSHGECSDCSFCVCWDLPHFLIEQYGRGRKDYFDLGSIITLTGSSTCTQATTCAQYICQTWPNSKLNILDLLQKALIRYGQGVKGTQQRVLSPRPSLIHSRY